MKLPWDRERTRRNGHTPPDDLAALGRAGSGGFAGLEPGDAISFWGEGNRLVTCVFDCAEGIGERSYTWRWLFLDDGSLMELSADGQWRYGEHEIIPQGSPRYAELVGTGGALEQFESRVRNDTVHDDPVVVELRGRSYQVTATGTVAVVRNGDAPRLSPWTQFVKNTDDNIYFSLVAADDENDGVLGIWTAHVCLSFGKPIAESDIDGIYPRT